MAIGETLLKITDYPFTYSIVLLWLRFSGINPFSIEAIPFLAIAGFVGTIIALLDPIGRIYKTYSIFLQKSVFDYYNDSNLEKKISFKILSKINPKLLIAPKMKKEWKYIEGAFHTKAIELEKDRIVSAIYFIIIIMTILYFLENTTVFVNEYPEFLITDRCDPSCAKSLVIITLIIIEILIVIITGGKGGNSIKNTLTVSTYLQSIGSLLISKTSIETLSKFIENGDWKTAEHWKQVVEEEHVNEENLRETRIQSVYNHTNSIFSNFKKHREKCKKNNQNIIKLAMSDIKSNEKTLSLREILQSFVFYERLVEHFYTNENKDIFEQIQNVFQFNKDWAKSFENTLNYKKTEIKNIILN